MKKIISVEVLPNHHLRLRYDDGVEGVVDLSNELGKEVFKAWADPKHWAAVQIEEGGGAVVWPGEIDLCADALYLEITGLSPEDIFPALRHSAHA